MDMDIEKLTKQQIVLLCLLIAFVTSIATGICVVRLMDDSQTIATPINRIIRQTIENVAPSIAPAAPEISQEEKKLLDQVKTISSLTAQIVSRTEAGKDTVIANGLFFGDNHLVVTPALQPAPEKQTYFAQSIFGEQQVTVVTPEKDYSILELKKREVAPATDPTKTSTDSATSGSGNTPTVSPTGTQ